MNDALLSAFFERDLTESEEDALSAMIQQSAEAALRFSRLAAEFYADLGLPEPRWPGEDPPKGFGGLAAAGTIGAILGGALAWHIANRPVTLQMESETPVPPVPVAVESAPASPSVGKARPATPEPAAPQPAAAESRTESGAPASGSARGTLLVIKVRLAEAGLLSVDLQDDHGVLIRRIFSDHLAAGDHRIPFNRKDSDGRMLKPGRYEVVVMSDGARSSQWLEIAPAHRQSSSTSE